MVKLERICLIAIGVVGTATVVGLAWRGLRLLRPGEQPVSEEVRIHHEEIRLREELRALVGWGKDEVKAKMGPPTRKREPTLPEGPFWGPGEGLGRILRPGQPYDEWTYIRGKWTLFVWFGDPADKEPDRPKWKVVATGVHREGTVY